MFLFSTLHKWFTLGGTEGNISICVYIIVNSEGPSILESEEVTVTCYSLKYFSLKFIFFY